MDYKVGDIITDKDGVREAKVLEVLENGLIIRDLTIEIDAWIGEGEYYPFDQIEAYWPYHRFSIPGYGLGREDNETKGNEAKLDAWRKANHMIYKSADEWWEALKDYIDKLYGQD